MVNNRMRGFVRPAGDPDITFNLDDPDVRAVNGQFIPVSARASQWARRWDPTAVTYNAQGQALITASPWQSLPVEAAPGHGSVPLPPNLFGDSISSPGRMGTPPQFKTYAEFFDECITNEQAQQIVSDIDLDFQPGSGGEHLIKNRRLTAPVDCSFDPYRITISAQLAVFKALQVLNWQFFDDFPVIGMRPYQWIKQARSFNTGTTFRIFRNNARSQTIGFWSDICLGNYGAISQLDLFAVLRIAATIVHEMRHSIPGGTYLHACNSKKYDELSKGRETNVDLVGLARNDVDLAHGGALSLEYWFWVWLSRHVPDQVWDARSSSLSDGLRKMIAANIDRIWEVCFCTHQGRPDGVPAGPAPLDPSQVIPLGGADALVGPVLLKPSLLPFGAVPAIPAPPRYGVPISPFVPPAAWFNPFYRMQAEQQWGLPWAFIQQRLTTV